MSTSEKELLKQFSVYVHGFDFDDASIARKYYHSLRVMDRAREIAESEKLSPEMTKTAAVAGLLHDYSRFEQWTSYHTYSDRKSIDHADRAVELLFDEGEIAKFDVGDLDYGIMRDSIKYHNKYAVPAEVTGNNLVLAKLIRDADKIDILEILTTEKNLFEEAKEPISAKVEECFYDHQIIDRRDVQNKNDAILLSLAMIYDLNYRYSFEYLVKNNMLERLLANLENRELFGKYFDYVREFMEGRR